MAAGLEFATVISSVATCPRLIPPGKKRLDTVGFAKTTPMSSALLLANALGGSPPPATRAVLTSDSGASRATLTVMVMSG